MQTHATKERNPARSPVQAGVSQKSADARIASPQGQQAARSAASQAALVNRTVDSPVLAAQRRLQQSIDTSPRQSAQAAQLASLFGQPLQRAQDEDEEPLQGRFEPVQRQGKLEEEEPIQGKFGTVQSVEEEGHLQGKFPTQAMQLQDDPAARPNNTGLPDNLKRGIEALAGMSMDNVKVHYNSSQPAQLNALAYAQGTDIHVAAGQEQHLPHEAWHVVQQAQGRVKPTMQMKGGVPVNDDAGLEAEADVLGARVLGAGEALGTRKGESGSKTRWNLPGSQQCMQPMLKTLRSDEVVPRTIDMPDMSGEKERRRMEEESREHWQQHIVEHGYDPVTAKLMAADPRLRAERAREYEEAMERKANDERQRALRQASKQGLPPSVVEVGAGEGRFSRHFRKKFGGVGYDATDIAGEEGPNGFLSIARSEGANTKFGVNANEVHTRYPRGEQNHVVAANPFGMKGVGGASFGLMKENPQATGKKKWEPDPRFLTSARGLLRPGGTVEIYGRSNVLRDEKLSHVPTKGLSGGEAKQAEAKRGEIKQKYIGENANPYLAISPGQLTSLAKETRFKVRVKKAKQPSNLIKGGNPDTKGGDNERKDTGLKPFNTRFMFTPVDSDYESDEENPRVDYNSGDESDWEE